MTSQEIEIALKTLREIKLNSTKDLRYGFDLNWEDFIKIMQFLSPKSFGTRIQNRIIEFNDFEKVNPSEDNGDFSISGKYYEFKTSILTTSNKLANFVGLRDYQERIDGYILMVIDTNSSPYKTLQYKLSKEQMKEELKIMKANPSNGTKSSNLSNLNFSYRFSIDLISDNVNSKRWDTYKIDSLKYDNR
ncbi:hypothetical protein Belba_0500 [Belliella baltica DSM 15883]|uniref:Uncharacterized protein n=1 Tax=Belliella baltica (strain DSM 15883 / CIP 108006 / LMG 21964 / BA134) TaxID=866536 RepID=I3Z1P0_BELBD|nr:hypothetical protein [Belliella baltica]AFL83158.1 hypothetical protein Belba_0500 [Belliella baltica DSM 15883]